MAGIGGAELRMLEHCGIELDYVHVMSRDLLRHADQSGSGRPQSRYFDGGWNSTSRRRRMTKGRLEGFSDGVIAILITIMVLELKVPHGTDANALRPLVPVFLTYVLSFVMVGIYCSGCRSRHSSPAGWARTTSRPCRRRCTAQCCSARPSPTRSFRWQSSE